MNILLYIHSLTGGGAERVTVSLARDLVDQGHDVGVVTMHSEERAFADLAAKHSNWDLVIIGIDPASDAISGGGASVQRLAEEMGVAQRVYLQGRLAVGSRMIAYLPNE